MIINQKYTVHEIMGKGSYGDIYVVKDLNDKANSLVCKMQKDKKLFEREVRVLKKLNCLNSKYFPKIHYDGMCQFKNVIVMDRFGANLQELMNKQGSFSFQTVNQIGM